MRSDGGGSLPRSKRILFRAVIVAATLVAAEVSAFLAGWIREGHPLGPAAWQRRRAEVIERFAPDDAVGEPRRMRIRLAGDVLHPYLGFVGDPTELPSLNELGFAGPESPLQQRAPDRLIVGVVGGSVAQGCATQGRPLLEALLGRHPALRGRRLVLVNLARGGFKQPQQLMTLEYLLALGGEFDAIVNVDGFNEVALHEAENGLLGVFPAFPRVWFMFVDPVPDPAELRRMGRHQALEAEMAALARAYSAAPWRWSMLANILWSWRHGTRLAQYEALGGAIEEDERRAERRTMAMMRRYAPGSAPGAEDASASDQVPYRITGPPTRFATAAELYEFLGEIWKNASLQLARLCRANGIAYVHVLQPNQYVAGSKPMGPAERALALNPRQPYRRGAEQGYPVLIRDGAALRAAGVRFVDLTGLFRDVTAPIYVDDCCHYNRQGYEMIVRQVAEALIDDLSGGPGAGGPAR